MKLRFKKLWAIDVLVKDQFIQLTSFKYKRDAIKQTKDITWTETRIEKRILLTDKYLSLCHKTQKTPS
jgi:hypothetical protein